MKKFILPGIIFLVILVLSIWFLGRSNISQEEQVEIPTPTAVLPTISDEVKVSLTGKNGNRAVVLNISEIPKDIVSVEYELTYLTGSGLPRGVLGKITVEESEVERDDIVLGTCSSGKCVFDTGVESIDLSLKFVSDSGGIFVYRNTFKLE